MGNNRISVTLGRRLVGSLCHVVVGEAGTREASLSIGEARRGGSSRWGSAEEVDVLQLAGGVGRWLGAAALVGGGMRIAAPGDAANTGTLCFVAGNRGWSGVGLWPPVGVSVSG
jgi:hypothetical protein